ncbi:winged helix-turn-helix transcriptional regulator [Streptomyces sp. NPDC006326]|uniref:winged helix-turn-helix transcriptional regulator n=1 Tax=Streptomyces sp. NPDC006326 TaxID=3156752 RepID=UPI0033AF63A0
MSTSLSLTEPSPTDLLTDTAAPPPADPATGDAAGTPLDVLGPEALHLDHLPVVAVPLRALRLSGSPRTGGTNEDHCRNLAAAADTLPPIVVHRPTMRVVDGRHRVRAAALAGREQIAARMVDGSAADAFVLAVRLNTVRGRGLVLSRNECTAAAARLVTSHPHWSNRMIASLTGLSAGTIGRIRGSLAAPAGAAAGMRVGKDGRVRPVDGSSGRMKVYELLMRDPGASIREIAQQVGVSPSTVHDVRKRVQAGEEPVPRRRPVQPEEEPDLDAAPPARLRPEPEREEAPANPAAIIAALTKDPSLRYNNIGRRLLRWLDGCHRGVAACPEIAQRVPSHNIDSVATLAREYAYAWSEFAAALEERHRTAC